MESTAARLAVVAAARLSTIAALNSTVVPAVCYDGGDGRR
jgi:hypothetical protein